MVLALFSMGDFMYVRCMEGGGSKNYPPPWLTFDRNVLWK